ncbi:DcaP family trimeric outer membrane transporter [Palleronia abyssalis]|nr:DcaP family trimeric outer membrane transporter [Palleronia abyssalis]
MSRIHSVLRTTALLGASAAALPALAQEEPLSFSNGSGTTIELYGYFKLDAVLDFGAELGNTTFPLVGITDDDGDTYFNATAQQTRIGVRSTTETSLGDFGTQIEVDFYGGAGAFGTENPFEPRVRHANFTYLGFLVGKDWTTFMPISSYPITLDFQGVAGIPFARQEQIRYTHEFGNYQLQLALEEHNDEVSNDPVAIAAIAYDTDPLLLRLSGLYGSVETGDDDDEDIYGFNLSTTVQLWEGATLDAAYTYGEGIASYLVFLGADVDSDGDAIEQQSAYVGLAQSIGDKLTVRAIYGWRDNERGGDADTENLSSLHLNADYEVVEDTVIGLEYFHGTRDTFGNGDFDVDRLQASVTYTF